MNRRTVCLTAVFGALSPPSVFAQEGKVTVFAAASMKDALDEINAAFTKSTGIKVDASYAGSQTLVQLIEEGSRADVFLSADTNWMDYGIQKKVIKDDSCFLLLGNTLVLIASKDSKLGNVTIKPGLNLAQLALMASSRLAMCRRYQSGCMRRKHWKSLGHGTLLPLNLQ